MSRTKDSENPYQSPATVSRRAVGTVRSFQVGVEEIHTVVVEASPWTGLKTHSTDAAGSAGPDHRGPCQFEVGQRERHRVQIEADGLGRVNAYVDGELVEANLFARLRAVIFSLISAVVVLAGVFLYFWITYKLDKVIEQWIDANW